VAYYLVKYKGEMYANRELVKDIFQTGDSGILTLMSDEIIRQKKILDVPVYAIGQRRADATRISQYVRFQDIDEQMQNFYEDDAPDENSYCVDTPCESMMLDLFVFIRLNDLKDNSNKYRTVGKLPHISYLGKKYIAVNTRVKGKDCIRATFAQKDLI
jgi:hypothetical protein